MFFGKKLPGPAPQLLGNMKPLVNSSSMAHFGAKLVAANTAAGPTWAGRAFVH